MKSKKLDETALWQSYQGKDTNGGERKKWVEKVYEAAVKYLLGVRDTFKNYTLHDETHVLNVMDAIGGLLGDQIEKLSLGELELLIIASCLHDIGMVYTEEERGQWLTDEKAYRGFLKKNYPELLGCRPADWGEDIQQRYLRIMHPFRIAEVLENESWKKLFSQCPLDAVPKRCILAVCQAHGQEAEKLKNNADLEYLAAHETDPLFCAILLRLGDLLDFDDTRAPEILYGYVGNNEKSREEWDKHRASAGFRYFNTPSAKELPYIARCANPGIEHAVRDFLDWVDEELGNANKLLRYCQPGWRQGFPFPRAILRNEIESDGYMSGDFCLTMDQEQILNLLMGENLYDNEDVFVREMLQNAIDATLLRGEMDPEFTPEDSRIDLWEWNDKDGYIWFRIDDYGTGMTLGMLQRYFLKVGNSYYTSKELERDLIEHGQDRDFYAISRFGIGFLSCFLSGDYVEVSTLYFDPEKNRREEAYAASGEMRRYGLRLQVTGLKGYYTLKNQAKQNPAEGSFPGADFCCKERGGESIERNGYRVKPGTSIAIRLDPGRLGSLKLCSVAKKYLCAPRVPVYYNGGHIGLTYKETMEMVHEIEGVNTYELSVQGKQKFDECFPAVRGNYPKLVSEVVPLDTKENQVLPEISGVLFKYDVRFDQEPEWKVKDLSYKIIVRTDEIINWNSREMVLESCIEKKDSDYSNCWGH